MNRLVLVAICCVFATAVGPAALAGEIVYVQSVKAKLLASPAFGAEVVATAARGDALDVLEKGPAWRRVKWQGKAGWVANLVVAEKPPLRKITVLDAPGGGVEPEARRRASAVVTAGASRGFLADARGRASQAEASDYAALARVEAGTPSEQEVDEFLRALEAPR